MFTKHKPQPIMHNLLKKNTILSLFLSFYIGTTIAQNYPLSDPSNTDGWILNQLLSDEFNGVSLDKSKWWILGENNDYRNKWKGRSPAQFAPHNVKLENGDLVLSSKWDPDFDFANESSGGIPYGGVNKSQPITQACILSERYFKYGYMEIRCKAADAPVTSSFWTTGYHSEIDMTENYGKRPIGNPENRPESLERKYRTNMISWDPDADPNHQNWKVESTLDVRVASDYYVYGFEWDPDYIKIYFEGELLRTATRAELEANDQWRHQYPQEIWIDSEVFSWYGMPTLADLTPEGEYKIDYVRIWQKELIGPDFNALGFEGPFYYQGRSRNWNTNPNYGFRMKDEKPASGNFSLRFQQDAPYNTNAYAEAPFGSLDLPSGSNEMKIKVWIDPQTTINRLYFQLRNPSTTIFFDLSGVAKGTWVELTKSFSRSQPSDQSLVDGDRVAVRMRGQDITSNSALIYIDDISFANDNSASVKRNETKVKFDVYPNPAQNTVTVSSQNDGIINFYNSLGVLVKSIQKNTRVIQIDTSSLQKGIYFVSVFEKDSFATKKLIIN